MTDAPIDLTSYWARLAACDGYPEIAEVLAMLPELVLQVMLTEAVRDAENLADGDPELHANACAGMLSFANELSRRRVLH